MDIEQDRGDAGEASPPSPAGTAISPKDLARRKFTIAGIAASGVLLTLVSQPGMASETCASPSSWASGGLQSRHGTLQPCAGKAPSDYKVSGLAGSGTLSVNPQGINALGTSVVGTGVVGTGIVSTSAQGIIVQSPAGWPSQVSPSTPFQAVFPCSGLNAGTFGKCTLGAILNHESFDTSKLGEYMVATYLNILSGRIGFPTAPQLQTIWYDWQTYGYYSPTAGVRWDANTIVTYLASTMFPRSS